MRSDRDELLGALAVTEAALTRARLDEPCGELAILLAVAVASQRRLAEKLRGAPCDSDNVVPFPVAR